jgi:hypothetical protein
VLEHQQPVVQQLVDGAILRHNADYPAHRVPSMVGDAL